MYNITHVCLYENIPQCQRLGYRHAHEKIA